MWPKLTTGAPYQLVEGDKCGSAANCVVRLKDATPFKWDKMFYFAEGVSETERQGAVGKTIRTRELTRQLLFIENGRVVRSELLPTDFEKPLDGEVAFYVGGKSDGWITCDGEAEFNATKHCSDKACLYELQPTPSGHCSMPNMRVTYEQVQDPPWELCTDDTLSVTEYRTVPFFATFRGAAVEFNEHPISPQHLLEWAKKEYPQHAEKALWVQVSPDSRLTADNALLPLVQSIPELHIREVPFGFTCPKVHRKSGSIRR